MENKTKPDSVTPTSLAEKIKWMFRFQVAEVTIFTIGSFVGLAVWYFGHGVIWVAATATEAKAIPGRISALESTVSDIQKDRQEKLLMYSNDIGEIKGDIKKIEASQHIMIEMLKRR